MSSSKLNEYQKLLDGVLDGSIKPSKIIGSSYKQGKSVASGWLRRQILALNGVKVCALHVATNGKGFKNEELAKKSEAYKLLAEGKYKLMSPSFQVASFQVIELHDGGYGVAVHTVLA